MRLTQIWIASLAFTFLTAQVSSAQPVMVYKDVTAPLKSRATDLFNRLNQDEKLSLLSGTPFTTLSIPRLEVPAMGVVDAGQGVRGGMEAHRVRRRCTGLLQLFMQVDRVEGRGCNRIPALCTGR